MKLFLIPISSRRTLIYCQRLSRTVNTDKTSSSSIADRITAKAAKTWHEWETSEKTWQKSIADAGNKLLSRIPFEEWGLKSIPSLSARRQQAENEKDDGTTRKIKVVYPPSVVKSTNVLNVLYQLGTERQSLHRTRLWWCIIGMPIVAPFALVPVIPNIPFFYLAFRAWSHLKALNGGKHLQYLVKNELVEPEPSASLDSIYLSKFGTGNRKGHVSRIISIEDIKTAGEDVPSDEEMALLEKADAKMVAEAVGLPELSIEVERACQQVENKLLGEQEREKERLERNKIE